MAQTHDNLSHHLGQRLKVIKEDPGGQEWLRDLVDWHLQKLLEVEIDKHSVPNCTSGRKSELPKAMAIASAI